MTDYLQPEEHSSLIRQLHVISEQTHISENYLKHVSAKELCTAEEMVWVRNVKKVLQSENSTSGLILYGDQDVDVPKKMMAIGATLVRNFIDARVYTMSSLCSIFDDRDADVPKCSVLIIPDLCIREFQLPKRHIHTLYGLLLERHSDNNLVIGYVDALESLPSVYGKTLAEYMLSHYDKIAATCTTV